MSSNLEIVSVLAAMLRFCGFVRSSIKEQLEDGKMSSGTRRSEWYLLREEHVAKYRYCTGGSEATV
jgi:hypothetical protein